MAETSDMTSQPQLVSYSKVPNSDQTAPAMDKEGDPPENNITPVEAQNGVAGPPPSYEAATDETAVAVEDGSASDKKSDKKEDGDEEKKEEIKMVGAMQLFRFADCWDILWMLLGTLSACAHGAALPSMLIVFGDMTDSFVNQASAAPSLDGIDFAAFGTTEEAARSDSNLMRDIFAKLNMTHLLEQAENQFLDILLDEMRTFAIYYIILGVAVLFVAYGQLSFWLMASFRQTQKIRVALFRSILRQEIGWFDTHEAGELNTRLSDDVNKICEGIGDKLGNFFQWFSTFLAGIIIGFIYGWKLTLVILAVGPVLAISGAFMTKLMSDFTNKELHAYAKAGAIAEEVLGAIRTVTAFGGQEKECVRYNSNLTEAKNFGVRKGLVAGGGMGLVFLIMFACYGLAFWYGSKLVREDPNYTPGNMLIVFFCVLIGAFALGNAAPNLQNYATARGAAYSLFHIIDNQPSIDSSSEEGAAPAVVKGNIEFKDIVFRYPARPEVTVLSGLNLKVSNGQTVALVGASGCGKSTTTQLLQRFYDPEEGNISVDGQDIRELNIQWLRQHIGVVSQEPVLFGTTIVENIRFGKDGVSQADIERAAIEANAHSFISKLPQGYNTLVGERGAQLSGGQKQRIAIARALVSDPRILLLDEATSALDTESEASVQAALDKARMGRTTIVIAHRLSTIKTADIIAGFQDGKVVEQGTHDELMAKGGVYHQLVTNQTTDADEDDEEIEEDEISVTSSPSKNMDMSHVSLKQSSFAMRESLRLKRGMSTISDKAVHRSLSGDGKAEEEEEKLPDPDLRRVMRLNAPEWLYIVLGCLGAILTGAVQPSFAIIFSEILGVYAIPNVEEQTEKANLYAGMFVVIGVVAGIAMFIQSYFFALSGEYLTMRLRQLAFQSLLRQEITYFDDHRNGVGALTTRLATDAAGVQGATGARLGTMCQSLASLGTGIIISFVYSWKLALAILAFVPFIMLGGLLQMKILAGYTQEGRAALEGSGKVAIEAIENMRTVAGLTKEPWFLAEFIRLTTGPYKTSVKKAHMNGITFSFTQCLTFFAHAAAFYLGAYLIKHDGLSFVSVFKVFAAIVFGAMAAGQANSFAPDYGKGKISASRLFQLFDRIPTIDSLSKEGETMSSVTGTVDFREVHFRYPTRPTVPVLQGLNLAIQAGHRIALVGSSGCGKSTSVSLLERFYDTLQGQVLLDGKDIKTLNVQWLRQQMGIVQQEPILFDCSIRENIAYGDNNREVSMDEIIAAARDANIHSFIENLPEGYETNVGDKGTQLSGGQKQRVAIARALVRNPKVLLLDEATSALDTESEKVVQEALDRAQVGRTSIVIAHRLSTIINADMIAVIRHGTVTELGTHSQLMEQRGFYYKLNNAQSRQK